MPATVYVGDVRETLGRLGDATVQCVVTSPPYFGLRDYGVEGQFGLEQTPRAYVESLVEVFRGVRRVLRDDGTVWLNLGDSYANSPRGNKNPGGGNLTNSNIGSPVELARWEGARSFDKSKCPGVKQKDLIGIPWRVALALQDDGWYLRADIIWHKPNPMPESVTDRPTKAHEYVFLLTKSERYYYDADAIREPSAFAHRAKDTPGTRGNQPHARVNGKRDSSGGMGYHPLGRNARSVWSITTKPYRGAHFATFPPELPERCLLAGSKPGDVVLDPFCGSGTTGVAALKHRRIFVGCELNPTYADLARERIGERCTIVF